MIHWINYKKDWNFRDIPAKGTNESIIILKTKDQPFAQDTKWSFRTVSWSIFSDQLIVQSLLDPKCARTSDI